MKTPLGPEDMVEALRERIKKEDLTLTASEAGRIIWLLERLSQRCAEAYQVVGSLAGLAEVMDDPAVQKALYRFSVPTRPGDVLPFVTQKDRQRVIPKRRSKAKSSPTTTGKKGRRKSRS
jgi:predicted nucleotidyltransferase